jgi:hypothetical protein
VKRPFFLFKNIIHSLLVFLFLFSFFGEQRVRERDTKGGRKIGAKRRKEQKQKEEKQN